MEYVGRKVAVMNLCMLGNEPNANDKKYIGKAIGKVVEIKHAFDNGLYLTDFFIPEYINEKNDWCHYGFLVLDSHNFSLIQGY